MSEEQLKAFLQAVKADAGLQEQLKAAGDADAVVAIAKAAGFVITVEEFQKAQSETSDEELEGLAGGLLIDQYFRTGPMYKRGGCYDPTVIQG